MFIQYDMGQIRTLLQTEHTSALYEPKCPTTYSLKGSPREDSDQLVHSACDPNLR